MKALPLLLSLSLILFATSVNAQWGKIKGEGPVVTQTIDLDDFHSIGLGISGDVILTQGSKNKGSAKYY